MQHLLTLNPENASVEEVESYSIRDAARAVIKDEKGLIALLHVAAKGYYKLPGGGIEDGEGKLEALERECIEETGCSITILEEIGSIVEYRKMFLLKQTSYCYLVTVRGEKGNPDFTSEEIENGFELVWLSYEETLEILSVSTIDDIEGRQYIVPRDITFLKAAKPFF